MVCATGTTPGTAHDHQDMSKQKEMTFAPDSSRGYNEDSTDAYAAKMIASEQGRINISNVLNTRDFHSVRG